MKILKDILFVHHRYYHPYTARTNSISNSPGLRYSMEKLDELKKQ